MNTRASALIDLLELKPHPEGGYFREVFRSSRLVREIDSGKERNAVTEIYFLLTADNHSRWHRVDWDETFHYYEGAAMELFWIEKNGGECRQRLLGEAADMRRPLEVVPAGCWQAARTTGVYTLVGCTVAPGFDFADFRLLKGHPEEAGKISTRFPELAALI
ncbi:MAG: cupin domain-containing protein [Thermodesulfobacteriota bacterium]